MKLASVDFVWLIIAAVFAIAKMWSKFATSQAEDDDVPASPPVRPRPQARPVVPPVAKPVTRPTWEASPEDLRKFMERLTRPPQPKTATPPPVVPPPPPKPATPPPTPAPVAAKPTPQPSRRTSPWAEAFRDRQNLRNIIIANEIIGPPRGA
jgi:hypothetical protein